MIGVPPRIFKKNKIDLDNENITITVTDPIATDTGESLADFVRDRKNSSGWATTDSDDSALTLFQVLFGDQRDIDSIFLIGNNFKDYDLEWFDGTIWQAIITAIVGNSDPVKFHEFTKILEVQGVRVRINKTFVVDDDKFLSQMIVTESLGEFNQFPMVQHEGSKNRKRIKLISGKSKVIQNSGATFFSISHKNQIDDNDLFIIETMFNSFSGFLFWPSGGDETQFRTRRIGFRKQDIFLMAATNELENLWGSDGRYCSGTDYNVKLAEIV